MKSSGAAKQVCRGTGDFHLPRSPHVLFPRQQFQPLTDEHQRSESRRDSASPQGIPPELSNLIDQVLAIERFGPLRREISCYARPTYAVGSRQMQRTHTISLQKESMGFPQGNSVKKMNKKAGIICNIQKTVVVYTVFVSL